MAGEGAKAEDFLPPHWKIQQKAAGDLNADGKTDYVFDMKIDADAKDTDALNYLESLRRMKTDDDWISGAGAIVIVDSRGDGKLHFSDFNRELTGADSLEIKNGVLTIQYNTGGNYHTDATYRFRRSQKTSGFTLIGFDVEHYCNSCPESTEAAWKTSENYLTNTRVETTNKTGRLGLLPSDKQMKILPLEVDFHYARFNDNVYGRDVRAF
ncbi:MAG TPA: hypothetical protein VGC97_22940 [Pyrinomonadaceae bacterium]|jgi:hypothetical protein